MMENPRLQIILIAMVALAIITGVGIIVAIVATR